MQELNTPENCCHKPQWKMASFQPTFQFSEADTFGWGKKKREQKWQAVDLPQIESMQSV